MRILILIEIGATVKRRSTNRRLRLLWRPSVDALERVPSSDNHAVDGEQNHRSDHRCDNSWPVVALTVKADGVPQESSYDRSGDTEQHRDDDAAGISSRHKKLRQRSDY